MKNLIVKIFDRFDLTIKKKKKLKKKDIAFLHIGKTGGTQIMNIFSKLTDCDFKVIKHNHNIKLSDISIKNNYFFSIRKPEKRFFSSFYSRLRKGEPRINVKWSKVEEFAFKNFQSANELAESIFLQNDKGKKARMAITGISHMNKNQSSWFENFSFLSQRPPLFIIRQENLISDVGTLFKILNINSNAQDLVDDDSKISHKNNYLDIEPLSELAIKNINNWYVEDNFFYKICSDWINTTKQKNQR